MIGTALLQLSPTSVATNADLLVFLVVGLLAGAHCLGMCGPLVSVYADRVSAAKSGRRDGELTAFEVRQHALFNAGRAVGYAAVGALFGLLGGALFASVDVVSSVGDDVRAVTGIAVGALVLLGGISYLLRGTNAADVGRLPGLTRLFGAVSATLTTRIERLAGSTAIVGLGAVHAILPCPIIYPAYLYAFAIGDPLRGGLSLFVLGIGTFPTLFLYGTAIGSISTRNRVRLHRVLGVSFCLLGYIPLSHGLVLLGVDVPHLDLPYYQPLT